MWKRHKKTAKEWTEPSKSCKVLSAKQVLDHTHAKKDGLCCFESQYLQLPDLSTRIARASLIRRRFSLTGWADVKGEKSTCPIINKNGINQNLDISRIVYPFAPLGAVDVSSLECCHSTPKHDAQVQQWPLLITETLSTPSKKLRKVRTMSEKTTSKSNQFHVSCGFRAQGWQPAS